MCVPHVPSWDLCTFFVIVSVQPKLFFWTFFETPVWETHSHIIDFLAQSQELIVITVFFGTENEMLVWQCWCSSGLQQNDVTHSWPIENCKAALAVCKQTWVCGGISGWKYCIFLLKVKSVIFLRNLAWPHVSYVAHCHIGFLNKMVVQDGS